MNTLFKKRKIKETITEIKELLKHQYEQIGRLSSDPKKQKKIDKIKKLVEEIDILSNYLPKQLSDSELNAIVNSDQFTDMKSGMQYFKANYSNQYDGKVVQNKLLARFNIVPTRTV